MSLRNCRLVNMLVVGLFLLSMPGAWVRGQGGSLSVSASAGGLTPNPALTDELTQSSLSASVSNPPSGSYECPIEVNWSWSVEDIAYKDTQAGSWQSSSASVMVDHPNSTSPSATLTAYFPSGGYWKVTLRATVTYSNSPCTDIWSTSGVVDVTATAIEGSLSPDPLGVAVGANDELYATPLPSDASSSTTSADSSIASISGGPTTLTVTGVSPGTTVAQLSVLGRLVAQSWIDVDSDICPEEE